MHSDIVGAICAFAAGAAIAAAGYLASRQVLKKRPNRYILVQTVKQLVQIGFLVALFLLGDRTPWDRIWLLVGGCLGITLPMIYFTARLVKLNDSLRGKEEHKDG